jgi:hypothetical protein
MSSIKDLVHVPEEWNYARVLFISFSEQFTAKQHSFARFPWHPGKVKNEAQHQDMLRFEPLSSD